MFEQTFKHIDDVLRKEAGCSSELDHTEQTSWMLFLKYLDDFQEERAKMAALEGRSYDGLLDAEHQGGANDESNWRQIMEHFAPAVQLGLTATPKRTANVDTYRYFGEPVYRPPTADPLRPPAPWRLPRGRRGAAGCGPHPR